MATVVCFELKESWKYTGINPLYEMNFAESIGAVIAKGNIIEGIEAKE